MALVKSTLKSSLYDGLLKIYRDQANKATSGDEDESPEAIIKQISNDMAEVIANSVDSYIKSGDITIGPSNISVISPLGLCVVTPASPAKMK